MKIMKKIIIALLLVLSLANPVMARKAPKLPKGIYPHMAMVTKVQKPRKGKRNLIIAVDGAGRELSWYNKSEYWCKGDFAAMIMYNNGTRIIYDDIILGEPMYVGFKDLF